MISPLKVGVIGLGFWGSKLVRNFAASPWNKGVVGCDLSAQRRAECEQKFGIPVVADAEEVLQDPSIDAVSVATPPPTHYALSKRALECGKHVLVEKPPTLSLDELVELIGLCRRQGLRFMVDSTFVYSEVFQQLKKLIREGYFKNITYLRFIRYGDVLRNEKLGRLVDAMYTEGMDAIGDLAFHDLSLLVFLFERDAQVRSVSTACNIWDSLCDTAFVDLDMEGIPVHIGVSWVLPERRRDLTIFDREKFTICNDLQDEAKLLSYYYREERQEILPVSPNGMEPLQSLVNHYLESISSNREPLTGCDFMYRVMSIFDRIRRAQGNTS